MRAVTVVASGQVELSFMWLPTFIGMDTRLKERIEKELSPLLVGKELTGETLDWAHEKVLDIICQQYPLPGLREYLDAMKFVES